MSEAERRRIAENARRTGAAACAIKIYAYGMRIQLPMGIPSLNEDSQTIVSLIDKSIKTTRDSVSDLRPAVLRHGIAAAMEWLVAESNKHPAMSCELTIKEDDTPASDELTTLVFRPCRIAGTHRTAYGISPCGRLMDKQSGWHCLTIRHDGRSYTSDLAYDNLLIFFGVQECVTASGGEIQRFSSCWNTAPSSRCIFRYVEWHIFDCMEIEASR